MSVIKINIDKPIQEFDIGGNIYEMPYDDESLQRYMSQMRKFHKRSVEFSKKPFEDMTEKEQTELEAAGREESKQALELFFGEGSYESIYEACGKSVFNLLNVIEAIGEFVQSKTNAMKQEKKNSYTKRK
ncbi:hypothetical protein CPT06_11205 [Bacillus vallismortis]|uniref:hypothetical protein n=1 Tax=Bacillus vallismortis TaxID=72361 RepID=UPI000C29DDD5|nr:hypothetical protein [Bacillus vallismortis]PJZ00384.1 hypothetical protein CPT06_11205 [Bacillus vallismortis]